MTSATVTSATEVVVIDRNETVRAVTVRVLTDLGLKVTATPSVDRLKIQGRADRAPLVVLDVSADPSIVVELPGALPAPIADPDRLVLTCLRRALVETFSMGRRSYSGLIERPYSPATLVRAVAAFFPERTFATFEGTNPGIEREQDWQRLSERLLRSGEMNTVRAPATQPVEPRTQPGFDPIDPEFVEILDISEEVEVVDPPSDETIAVDPAIARALAAGRGIELAPIDIDDPESELVSVDSEVVFGELEFSRPATRPVIKAEKPPQPLVTPSVLISPPTADIEVVSEIELDIVSAEVEDIEFSSLTGIVPDEGDYATREAAALDPMIALARRDGGRRRTKAQDIQLTVDASVVPDGARPADPHVAMTRVAAVPDLPSEVNYTIDVAEDDIEEVPAEFVVSMDRVGGAHSQELEAAPPPAPQVRADLVDGLYFEGVSELIPLSDALTLMSKRGVQGVIEAGSDESQVLIFVDGDMIRWVERMLPDRAAQGLPAAVAGAGLATESVVLRTLAATGDTGRHLPEILAEQGVGTIDAIYQALNWWATECLWDLMARVGVHYRMRARLTESDLTILDRRPLLQVSVRSALFEFFRTFPDRSPPLLTRPGMFFVTDPMVASYVSQEVGLQPLETWLLECMGEPRTIDGLLELAADNGHDVDFALAVLNRLRDFGLVIAVTR